jgi:hypothetical protein
MTVRRFVADRLRPDLNQRLTNLLYFCRIRLFASFGFDFQGGSFDLAVRRIQLALRQVNAEEDA